MMKKSVRKVLACSLAAALAVTGLGDFGVASAASKKTKKITMNVSTVLIKKGKTAKLKVKSVKPKKASKKVTYKVANKKIASVNKKGVVKGKKIGTTTVKVTSKVNKKATAKVKVIVAKVVPTKVTMKKKLNVTVGKKKTLKVTVKPAKVKKAHKKGTWSTNKKKVATVTKKGVVKGVKVGKAKITFTTLNGKKATCTVTVTGAAVSGPAVTTPPAVTATYTAITGEKVDMDGVAATKYVVAADAALKFNVGNSEVDVPAAALAELLKEGTLTPANAATQYQKWCNIKTTTLEDVLKKGNLTLASLGIAAGATNTLTETATKNVKHLVLANAGAKSLIADGEYDVTVDEKAAGSYTVKLVGTSVTHNSTYDVTVADKTMTVAQNGQSVAKVDTTAGTIAFTIADSRNVKVSKEAK